MKKILVIILCLLAHTANCLAGKDDGKVCPVEGGSVQGIVTKVSTKIIDSGTGEATVSFYLTNSSPNFVNATYVIRGTANEKAYVTQRVFLQPQQASPVYEKTFKYFTNDNPKNVVIDVIGADCKQKGDN